MAMGPRPSEHSAAELCCEQDTDWPSHMRTQRMSEERVNSVKDAFRHDLFGTHDHLPQVS